MKTRKYEKRRKKYLSRYGRWMLDHQEKYPPGRYYRVYTPMRKVTEEDIARIGKEDGWLSRKSCAVFRVNKYGGDKYTFGGNIVSPGFYRVREATSKIWLNGKESVVPIFVEDCAEGLPLHHRNGNWDLFEADKRDREKEGRRKRLENEERIAKEKEERRAKEEKLRAELAAKNAAIRALNNKQADQFFQGIVLAGALRK